MPKAARTFAGRVMRPCSLTSTRTRCALMSVTLSSLRHFVNLTIRAPGWAPATQQQSLGGQSLVERELVELWAVPDQADPAPDSETFVAGRVLNDTVERDVVDDDDLSHLISPFVGVERWSCLSFARFVVFADDWTPEDYPAIGAFIACLRPGPL